MFSGRFLFALLLATVLILVFLVAVREGRLASPGHRTLAVIIILVAALLVWLVPFPAH